MNVEKKDLAVMIDRLVMAMRRADPLECELFGLTPIEDEEWNGVIEAGEDMLENLS